MYLDSGKRVRILGRVLDSGMCFGFWEVFWVLGRVFGFWDVFWILGSVLDSGTCFVPTSHRMYILKQLFFSISVNSGFGNIYLAAFAAR